MIPLFRSHKELMIITQARIQSNDESELNTTNKFYKLESKIIDMQKHDKKVNLPKVPRTNRRQWVRGKRALSKLLDELDYNNQIQSSYDLTLLDGQNNFDHQDIA